MKSNNRKKVGESARKFINNHDFPTGYKPVHTTIFAAFPVGTPDAVADSVCAYIAAEGPAVFNSHANSRSMDDQLTGDFHNNALIRLHTNLGWAVKCDIMVVTLVKGWQKCEALSTLIQLAHAAGVDIRLFEPNPTAKETSTRQLNLFKFFVDFIDRPSDDSEYQFGDCIFKTEIAAKAEAGDETIADLIQKLKDLIEDADAQQVPKHVQRLAEELKADGFDVQVVRVDLSDNEGDENDTKH